jgi:formylglycine-generating enzyme required for sulfatase activity
VERASFEDVQIFLRTLNGLVNGLNLTLPSEAQWEYACRAGTAQATYAGEMRILGDNNAPVLDAIAWYGGNSGVDFDLDNGHDSSDWTDKQYPHTTAGTRPVGLKTPNTWGLHDMLGNVFEWCEDQWHDTYEGAPLDGSAWVGSGGSTNRGLRGGSWGLDARFVRAAFRFHRGPSLRDLSVGFRCARVQGDSEPSEPERSKPSERSEQAATTGPSRRRLRDWFLSKRKPL